MIGSATRGNAASSIGCKKLIARPRTRVRPTRNRINNLLVILVDRHPVIVDGRFQHDLRAARRDSR